MATHTRLESRVLVASDDRQLTAALAQLLTRYRPDVTEGSAPSVLARLTRGDALRLLILVDAGFDSATLDLLQTIKERHPDLSVLLVSAHPTIEHATESIRRGAEDFVPVPYSDEVVLKEVDRILEAAELRARVESLNRLVATRWGFERIVSRSAGMNAVLDRATAASRSGTPVLIVGETGTGKELIARAIHANSHRAKRPFVPINCAALPRDLIESELFGHRRGAFSGAGADHPGLFASAHSGTVFLDEIGELPLEAQAKMLRVLQDGEVRAVGGLESRRVDVRVVAATNRSLAAMREGRMRPDLFYRLSVLVIEIPPLRDRRDDLPLLIGHFMNSIREQDGHRVDGIDAGALELLADYPFPGNVRELENMLEGLSIALQPGRTTIGADDVRGWLRRRGEGGDRTSDATHVPLKLVDLEAWAIAEAMRQAHGNKTTAAHILGISRDTLYRKLREVGLASEVPDSRTMD